MDWGRQHTRVHPLRTLAGLQSTLVLSIARLLLSCRRVQWLQQHLVRLPPLEHGEGLIQNVCKCQRAVWLLEVALVPIVYDLANVAVLERRRVKHSRDFGVQDAGVLSSDGLHFAFFPHLYVLALQLTHVRNLHLRALGAHNWKVLVVCFKVLDVRYA